MGYKVLFENNAPIGAIEMLKLLEMNDFLEVATGESGPVIKSLYVEANNEADAIEMAGNVVRKIWGKIVATR